jgi:hypothetical protein
MRISLKAIVVAVLAVAVALPLSGCSVIAPLVKSAGESSAAATAKPAVGQCWRATDDDVENAATWYGDPAVDCSTTHQSYTVSVVTLSKSLPDTWANAKGNVRVAVDDAAWNACSAAALDTLGTLNDLTDRFAFAYYLPSETAWLGGARWARCDVSLYKVGSLLSSPRLTTLPANFQNLVISESEHPEKYTLCLDTADPATDDSDPFSSDSARYADCTADPQWRERWVKDLPGDDASPLPSDDTIAAFAQDTCGSKAEAAGQTWITYTPTDDSWAWGDRAVECWVSDEVSPTT